MSVVTERPGRLRMRVPSAAESQAERPSAERGWATAGRFGWGLADQSLSSLTSFALAVLVARTLSPSQFGAFSLAFSGCTLALGSSRALAAEPLLVRHSGSDMESWRAAARAASGTSVVVGSILGLGVLVAAWAMHGPLRQALLPLGLLLPALLLQDLWRDAFFSIRKGHLAFLNDLSRGAMMLAPLLLLPRVRAASVSWFVFAWAGSAAVAAALGALQAGTIPRPCLAGRWLSAHRDLAPRYLGEFLAMNFALEFVLYGVAAAAGLSAAGAYKGAGLLMGPLNVLFVGVALAAIPEAVGLFRAHPSRLRPVTVLLSVTLAAGVVMWTSVVLLLPDRIGRLALGESWVTARAVVLPMGVALVASSAVAGALFGLRALAAARQSLKARLITASLMAVGGISGAVTGGARGAAWGVALTMWMGAIAWWWYFTIALRECRRAPAEGGPAEGAVASVGSGPQSGCCAGDPP
ncbi:MAG: hypothetical protein WDA71_01480 [Actinomycetota bacterium]